jgi:hypothetical protein
MADTRLRSFFKFLYYRRLTEMFDYHPQLLIVLSSPFCVSRWRRIFTVSSCAHILCARYYWPHRTCNLCRSRERTYDLSETMANGQPICYIPYCVFRLHTLCGSFPVPVRYLQLISAVPDITARRVPPNKDLPDSTALTIFLLD